MANRADITPIECRQLLRYDPATGKLFWWRRTPDMFDGDAEPPAQSCKRWNVRYANSEAFTKLVKGYRTGALWGRYYPAHRVIWAMMTGVWPTQDIDHINQDRCDNRWENLRDVPRYLNNRNQPLRHNSPTEQLGVGWVASRHRWRAVIGTRYIGHFLSFEEAVAARKSAEAALGYHPNHGTQLVRPLQTK